MLQTLFKQFPGLTEVRPSSNFLALCRVGVCDTVEMHLCNAFLHCNLKGGWREGAGRGRG